MSVEVRRRPLGLGSRAPARFLEPHTMKTRQQSPTGARRFLTRLTALAATLALALTGCSSGGGGGPGFTELLVVADGQTLVSFSVSGENPTRRGTATIPGIPGTYTRTGTTVTITIMDHNVPDDSNVRINFTGGTGGNATDGQYVATRISSDMFTVEDTATGDITNGTLLRAPSYSMSGTYEQVGNTVTVTIPNHGLEEGDGGDFSYTSGTPRRRAIAPWLLAWTRK